jgi:hypothetical protein
VEKCLVSNKSGDFGMSKDEQWNICYNKLNDLRQFDGDEGISAPTDEIFQLATHLLQKLKNDGEDVPQIILGANGEIVFEYRDGDISRELEVSEDGVEYLRFEGTHLVERKMIEL